MAKKRKKSKKIRKKIKIKKKSKKSTFKKSKITKRRKKVRKFKFRTKKITKRSKIAKKLKKKKQPIDRLKAIRLPRIRKIKKLKIRIKKRKDYNIKKKLGQLTTKIINFALYPLFRAYDSYLLNRRQKKLKEENERIKEQEREKRERRRLIKEQKEQELRDKIRFAEKAKTEMQVYLRQAEREARKEKAAQHKKILENLKIDKQIQKFEERMQREQKALSVYALKNIKENYEPILEKISAIKERYKKLQNEILAKKLSELGLEVSGDEDKSALLEKERQFIYERSKIENALLPYTRSLRSMAFQISKNHLSKNMSPLKVIDLSMENGEVYLNWMEDESNFTNDFLMLCYIKENSLESGRIVLEIKTDPDRHSSHEFNFNEIFRFQSIIIDSAVAMLERMRNQKKEN